MSNASSGRRRKSCATLIIPALHKAVPSGIQHVAAMFVSNISLRLLSRAPAVLASALTQARRASRIDLLNPDVDAVAAATLFRPSVLARLAAAVPIVQGTSLRSSRSLSRLLRGKGSKLCLPVRRWSDRFGYIPRTARTVIA